MRGIAGVLDIWGGKGKQFEVGREKHEMSISANIINCCAHNDGIQTITAKPMS